MKRIILTGPAASGKDFFKDFLTSKGFMPSVSHTTRPMRDTEEYGKTYHFITRSEFSLMIYERKFYEYKTFNNWNYGTTKDSFDRSDVFIFTPSGVNSLSPEVIEESIIVYFDIPEIDRIKRLQGRSDSDTIKRRMEADEKDFKDFDKWNIRVNDTNFDPEKVLGSFKNF